MIFCDDDGGGSGSLRRAVGNVMENVMGFLIGSWCESPISIRYRGRHERGCLTFIVLGSISDERDCLTPHSWPCSLGVAVYTRPSRLVLMPVDAFDIRHAVSVPDTMAKILSSTCIAH